MVKHKCEGKRHQVRRGTMGVFKCNSRATRTVTTNVGFSETHYVCNSAECFQSIACGYPAQSTPFSAKK